MGLFPLTACEKEVWGPDRSSLEWLTGGEAIDAFDLEGGPFYETATRALRANVLIGKTPYGGELTDVIDIYRIALRSTG